MTTEPGRPRTPRELFDKIAANHLRTRQSVSLERVMHNEGLKVNAKLYAFESKGHLIVKVGVAKAARLSNEGLAQPYEPRPGRKMKEWIALGAPATATDERRWQRLAADAYRFVADQHTPATPRKPL